MLTFRRLNLGAFSPRTADPYAKDSVTYVEQPKEPSAGSLPTPGMCTPDGTRVWVIGADGTGHWQRRATNQTCNGTWTGTNVVPDTGPNYFCAADGLEYVLNVATGAWDPTGRTCTPEFVDMTVPPPAVNTITNAYSATNLPTGNNGGISVTERPTLRTWAGKRDLIVAAKSREEIQRLISVAPSLPPCPDSCISMRGEQTACYDKSAVVNFDALARAPGSFEMFGVPFHVSELLSNGRFEKNAFVPDAAQLMLINVAILERSSYTYRDYDSISFSVKAAMQNRPGDFRTFVEGFALNPVQPTEEEMTTGGGYAKWRARGGYPISLEVLRGSVAVTGYGDSSGFSLHTCASISCACPQNNEGYNAWRDATHGPSLIAPDQEVHLWPRCIGALIGKDGLVTDGSGDGGSWNTFVSQNGERPSEYSIHIVFDPEHWTVKAAGWLAEQLSKLALLFCATAPAVKQQLDVSTAEKCIDKQQKPCTKGAPNCTCTKPSNSTVVGVNAFNAWATYWCSEWMEESAPPPTYEEPIPVPEVPPELEVKKMPLWKAGLIAVGAVVTGAYFSSRRH